MVNHRASYLFHLQNKIFVNAYKGIDIPTPNNYSKYNENSI
jgi:hypothetical protein